MRIVFTGIDTKPANSLAFMLRSIGHEVFMLSDKALEDLRKRGYTGGVDWSLLERMGYSRPAIPYTDLTEEPADLFIDLKLKDLESYLAIFPRAQGALYVINGGWDDYEDYGLH